MKGKLGCRLFCEIQQRSTQQPVSCFNFHTQLISFVEKNGFEFEIFNLMRCANESMWNQDLVKLIHIYKSKSNSNATSGEFCDEKKFTSDGPLTSFNSSNRNCEKLKSNSQRHFAVNVSVIISNMMYLLRNRNKFALRRQFLETRARKIIPSPLSRRLE